MNGIERRGVHLYFVLGFNPGKRGGRKVSKFQVLRATSARGVPGMIDGGERTDTADCHPRLMSKMSDELTTRFLCGLVSRLESPDLQTRRLIVRAKMQPFAGQISDDSMDFVARRFVHSVRELEGALHTLQTWYSMTKRKVSIQTARQALSELERDCIRVVRLPDIEAAVCQLFGIDAGDLKSEKRTRSVSQPRMLAMFLARRHTQAAYKEIGDFFGGRNHSTVVAAEKKVDPRIAAYALGASGAVIGPLRYEPQAQASPK